MHIMIYSLNVSGARGRILFWSNKNKKNNFCLICTVFFCFWFSVLILVFSTCKLKIQISAEIRMKSHLMIEILVINFMDVASLKYKVRCCRHSYLRVSYFWPENKTFPRIGFRTENCQWYAMCGKQDDVVCVCYAVLWHIKLTLRCQSITAVGVLDTASTIVYIFLPFFKRWQNMHKVCISSQKKCTQFKNKKKSKKHFFYF